MVNQTNWEIVLEIKKNKFFQWMANMWKNFYFQTLVWPHSDVQTAWLPYIGLLEKTWFVRLIWNCCSTGDTGCQLLAKRSSIEVQLTHWGENDMNTMWKRMASRGRSSRHAMAVCGSHAVLSPDASLSLASLLKFIVIMVVTKFV